MRPRIRLLRVTGASLFEVLVAITFLLGATLWVLYVDFLAQRAMQDTHVNTLITKGVVEYMLEFARDQPFANMAGLTGAPSFPIDASICPMLDAAVSPQVAAAVIGAQVSAVWADPPTNANLIEVTVRVDWKDSAGRARTNSASTRISRYGLTYTG